MSVTLTPGTVSLETLARIYWEGTVAVLDPAADQTVQRGAERWIAERQ